MPNQEYTQHIDAYAKEVSTLFKSKYTEHTFRGTLQTLLNNLLPQYTPINEPQRTACGAPDYALIDHNQQPHAYIEAKDLFDKDLRGLKEHKPQFDRYKQALPRVCFTDYLEFHFYNNGEQVEIVSLLKEDGKGKFIPADPDRFVSVLKDWSNCPIQPITTAKRLADVMASKARLLTDAVNKTMESTPDSELHGQYKSFKKFLISDLTEPKFADLYSQTIVYGMFAAKIHDNANQPFTRERAEKLIPVSNPFLRKFFHSISFDLPDSVAWIVDDLADAFNATQMDKVMGKYAENELHIDPLVYFYEDFLSAYDPKLKEICGVYYTPQPVVSFIVRTIDDILKRDFNIADGLADKEKAKRHTKSSDGKEKDTETHRVQILDPATGTGTFLAEAVRLIHKKYEGNEGMWRSYVDEHLRPRLYGFELLMAPYTITHLKLDMLMGSGNEENDRLRVFLTNSLGGVMPDTGDIFSQWIVQEITSANAIKDVTPIMVMMGNPPYSVSSSNKSPFIEQLVDPYKKGLKERNIQPLSDDYIKFIRLCHHFIDKNGSGIFGVITNNSYLDGLIHRRMRELLLDSFDHIYIVNLHGNSRKKETAPDGTKDENVFDIMAGVSIAIFVKLPKKEHTEYPVAQKTVNTATSLATLHYLDLYGLRKEKYATLSSLSLASAQWQELSPSAPNYFFVPKDFSLQEEYEKGIKIDELFNVFNCGYCSEKDGMNIFFTDQERKDVLDDIKNMDITRLCDKYELSEEWATKAKDTAKGEPLATETLYRPFDKRYTNYFEKQGLMGRPRFELMRHMIKINNIALLAKRGFDNDNSAVGFVTDMITDRRTWSSPGMQGSESLFPLYLYDDANSAPQLNINTSLLKHALRHVFPHFSPSFIHYLSTTSPISPQYLPNISPMSDVFSPDCSEKDAEKFAALTFFCYIYALLHSPSYRHKYREFLKIDFPRIPLPTDPEEYLRLVRLGDELINLHLMRTTVETGHAPSLPTFPIEGGNMVDAIKYSQNRVYINSSQYFDNVPEEAWDFYVGGYQPAQKWMKDRKGRMLNYDEIEHYRRIVAVLKRTGEIMGEIG